MLVLVLVAMDAPAELAVFLKVDISLSLVVLYVEVVKGWVTPRIWLLNIQKETEA
jgi:hypothetical protein